MYWGSNYSGQCEVLPGVFTQIAAGRDFTVALHEDGKAHLCGEIYGVLTGEFSQVVGSSGGNFFSVLRENGTIALLGMMASGQNNFPELMFKQISLGSEHCLGLVID